MPFSARVRAYLFLTLCSVGLLLLMAGCTHTDSPASTPATPSPIPSAVSPPPVASTGEEARTFVGDSACAGCHHDIAQVHQASNHALTLHAMDIGGAGRTAPPEGRIPGLPFTLKVGKHGYYIDTYPPTGALQKLDYAFGAGKHGVTYAAVMPPDPGGSESQLLEMRASYFPHARQWRSTPGQEKFSPDTAGRVYAPEFSRKCIGCHVVTLPPDKLTPEPRFLGVGCEACHGPASAHVAAMQAKPNGTTLADPHIERIKTWGAQRLNEMCGKCHGTAASVGSSKPQLLLTPRFQPYALMLSRCFQESSNTLSCVTCHNAHQNTSHDQKAYEAACLNCHGGKAQGTTEESKPRIENPQTETASVHGKTCPVNPRTGCIGCHMPAGRVMPGSMVGSVAPDHYIRVYRPEQEAASLRQPTQAAAPATNFPMAPPGVGDSSAP